jgi:hypothetical protein
MSFAENRSLLKVGLDPGNVAFGSISEVGARNRHVRFPPISDQIADID